MDKRKKIKLFIVALPVFICILLLYYRYRMYTYMEEQIYEQLGFRPGDEVTMEELKAIYEKYGVSVIGEGWEESLDQVTKENSTGIHKDSASEEDKLEPIEVIPHKGIGKLMLGMSKSDIDKLYSPQLCDEKKIDSLVVRGEEKYNLLSVDYGSRYEVLYDEDHMAIEIYAIISSLDDTPLILAGMELESTKVEDVLQTIGEHASFTYDGKDVDLATTYEFEDLGLTLWRERGFHEKLLNDPEFLSMSEIDQEYEQYFMFFDTVSIY